MALYSLKTNVLFSLQIEQNVEKWHFEGVETRLKHVANAGIRLQRKAPAESPATIALRRVENSLQQARSLLPTLLKPRPWFPSPSSIRCQHRRLGR